EFREEMQMTLKNAYLMPASSRDAIESFLISRQADFKVGFIGSKKKTKDEMISRRLRLLNILQETANTTIEWKLKEKLHGLLQDYHLVNEATANTIQAFHIELPSERLDQQLHSGAKVNGQYVLNYSNDLSQAIKQHYRQTFNTLLN